MQVTTKWKDALLGTPDRAAVLNVCNVLSRATMDAIGEAAFDYQFDALSEEHESDMVRGYKDMMCVYIPSNALIPSNGTYSRLSRGG